jgi:transposase
MGFKPMILQPEIQWGADRGAHFVRQGIQGIKEEAMFKVLIGKQAKGGTTAQQEAAVELAALNLESQLNDKDLKVQSVESVFVHDLNPLHAEVIAVVEVADSTTKKEK